MKIFFTLTALLVFNFTTLSAQNGYCIAKAEKSGIITVYSSMIDAISVEELLTPPVIS